MIDQQDTFSLEVTAENIVKFLESEKAVKYADDYLDNGVLVTFAVPYENKENIIEKITDLSSGKATAIEERVEYIEYL